MGGIPIFRSDLNEVSHSYYLRIYCAKKLSLLSSIAFQIQTTPTPGEDHDLMIHHSVIRTGHLIAAVHDTVSNKKQSKFSEYN